MSKTARRSGQIKKLKGADNLWRVRWFVGRVNGKRRYKSKQIEGTKKDAQKHLNRMLHALDLNAYVEPSKLTVNAFLDDWLERRVGSTSRSVAEAGWLLKRYVRPHVGHVRLDRLTAPDIQAIVSAMLGPRANGGKRPYSPRTVRMAIGTLSQALRQAVRWKLIHRNPAEDVDKPKKRGREMLALTLDQVEALCEALRSPPCSCKANRGGPPTADCTTDCEHTRARRLRLALVFDVLVWTGLRPGEACALRWRDVDLEAGKLTVRRAQTVEVSPETGKLTRAFHEPKTPKSRRTIPLTADLVGDLRAHREKQEAEAKEVDKHGDLYDRGADLVFADELGGPINHHALLRYNFKPAVRRAGLDPRLRVYDLRHTHATLLMAAGENVKVVSERLGHASAAMTLDVYAHVTLGMQEAATKRLESMIAEHRAKHRKLRLVRS